MKSFRPGFSSQSSFFPSLRSALLAGVAIAGLLAGSAPLRAQTGDQTAPSKTTATAPAQQPEAVSAPGVEVPTSKAAKKKAAEEKKAAKKAEKAANKNKKEDKVVQSKDTRLQARRLKKEGGAVTADAKLPDKVLYDKALNATKHGHFDIARLDLQTLLNTYPDSQYMMRAKLAVADSWYKEGGTAALTQAESEYKDFETFFPNAPEAAEAQMRVGDIYFREMDKPDRDYTKATHAEEEYRLMLQQYPDSSLVPAAKQRLREVQEVLATRESNIAAFYATHSNWAATIARYQTVADTYPQYSHMDDTLIGLGDAYEAEAKYIRGLKLPEGPKAHLERIYDGEAIAAYSKVVTEHSAAPHVEDARDRLDAMGVPIPKPTAEQVAASEALEASRAQYRITDRARLFIMHSPDVVTAARTGEPTLADPKPTLAPDVARKTQTDFAEALNPKAKLAAAAAAPAAATDSSEAAAPAAAAPAAAAVPAAPLALEDVPTAGAAAVANGSSAVTTDVSAGSAGSSAGGSSMGVEIVSPSSGSAGSAPAAAPPAADPNANGGLKAVGPTNNTPLPPIEKPAAAPDQVNDVANTATPQAQATPANGKKVKPEFDKGDESSSKHKKKKGLDKLNPF
ncbi:MAG TPA: outer membrane protein assembly factor BamD [Granulicella sp.]|nr:outer membrane protein assembly factor BamD [Granulicella sp.]